MKMQSSHFYFTVFKKALLSFLMLFNLQNAICQSNREIDSLVKVANTYADDTSKVTFLTSIGRRCLDLYLLPEAKTYLSEALALGEKLKFKKGIAYSYYFLGLMYKNDGDNNEALKNMETCLSMMKEIDHKSGIARTYFRIGELYSRMGDDTAALENLMISLKLATNINDKTTLVNVYSRLGLMYDFAGDYPKGMKYYLASLKIAEDIGDKYGIGAANVNIGCIKSLMGEYEEVLNHNLAAAKIWKEMGNKRNLADAYTNIGEAYANLCNIEEAEKYTLMGVNIAKEIGYRPALGAGLTKMGIIYASQGDLQNALNSYLASLEVWKSEGDKRKIAATLLFVGGGYEDIQNIPKAITYYNQALTIAKENDNKLTMVDAYKDLWEAYSLTGNFKEALKNARLQNALNDSMWSESNLQEVLGLKEQFESEKKDKEIELLNKESTIRTLELKKQKQTIQYFITGIGLLGLLSFVVYRNYNTRQELKLQTLRNKIAADLHDDVGSTLSSISIISQMAQPHSKEMIAALETIGESSRKMLDAMTDIVWTINPENDQFEKIIMRMRTFAYELMGAKQIDYQFMVDEEIGKIKLPMQARKNLYLIFKEATNNMVKYAQADQAMFSIKGKKNKLTMMIRDNGKGFDPMKESNGNGLKNMQKRAAEIGAKLWIDSVPGSGTTIKFELAA